VNGPGPESVSAKPAALTAVIKVLNELAAIAVSTMFGIRNLLLESLVNSRLRVLVSRRRQLIGASYRIELRHRLDRSLPKGGSEVHNKAVQ
jgi:hypothetical protein